MAAVAVASSSLRLGFASTRMPITAISPSSVSAATASSRSEFLGYTQNGLEMRFRHSRDGEIGLWPEWGKNRPRRVGVARAAVKRRKEPSFDNVVQREKKVRIVSKIKAILVKQPGHAIALLQLGKHRREIGLVGKKRVITLLNKYPAVFEVYEEGCNVMYVRLTEEAEAQFEEERKLKAELEVFLVEKLRKLVMMSVDKRLNVEKISHIKHDLGLPEDFKESILPKYPQYFKVVETETGSALEITCWDPLVAVSFAEKKAAESEKNGENRRPRIVIDGEEILPTALSNRGLKLPKGLSLSKKDRVVARKFQSVPYISPYSDSSGLDPASVEAEKRAAATVHELLSLTLEKKTLVDHLTHFKKDYKFSQRIHAMLIRHPEMFYVSFKGHRDSVFLREAYEGSELVEKDALFLAKERLRDLVGVRKVGKSRRVPSGEAGAAHDDEFDEEDNEEDSVDEDDEFDEEDNEEDSEDEDEDSDEEEEESKGPLPVKSYAPSPRKPVKTYKDLRPRSNGSRAERRPEVATIETTGPRERW